MPVKRTDARPDPGDVRDRASGVAGGVEVARAELVARAAVLDALAGGAADAFLATDAGRLARSLRAAAARAARPVPYLPGALLAPAAVALEVN